MEKIDNQELYRSEKEDKIRSDFVDVFRGSPIPDVDILQNLGLFISSKNLSRILFMDHMYKQIIDTQGIVIEFGCRWGQNLAIFSALRGIYEPFNRHRKIVGFDTFEGFPGLTDKDNVLCDFMREGGLSCCEGYLEYLEKIMDYQEQDNPLSHIKKYDIRKGDAIDELEKYLKEFPETIISLAYFDFDIYEPTKKCLEMIKPYLFKGSLIGFDELNDVDSPGETIALKEVFDLNKINLKRHRYTSRTSYFILD
ncbi:crotonobetainyl-CoA--carnitine CoA-transferase [Candidatus Pacearchaeota archaeon]|nr:crotonobetainyl-CoA--carnitine CoA-transferase [Candidatus Pacearchaeota archaeon]